MKEIFTKMLKEINKKQLKILKICFSVSADNGDRLRQAVERGRADYASY